jgi:NADPH:quinone reductase-like Zn-dependent oxidoreductase/uncharacterized protein YndB with AHSA1/START domain
MLQKIVRSTVIDAPIERVWAVIRDFNSHDRWHDVVETSRIEANEASSQVGCVRSFTMRDGNRIREQLLTLDDREYKSTYCIVEATVPLQRYVATVTLKPVTDGERTFWHWESTFATPPGRERELREMVARDVYEAGFANLRRHLQQGADLRAPGSAPMPAALALPAHRIVLRSYGGVEQLTALDGEAAAPGPGQVRVRQRAIGVNFIDVYLRRGWIPSMLAPGGTPGMEAAGSVIDVGPGVTGVLPGDRVACIGPSPGAYCNVRTVPIDWVVRLPPAVEDDIAAALLLKGMTAHYLLHDLGRVARGTRLLVHAAAGGVGLLVCAWARQLGATVVGTVSSEAKARIARDHGCEHVIVTTDYRFADAVHSACGGADVVIDGLGDAAFDENLAALAPCGHWISLGQASGPLRAVDPNLLVHKSLTFSRPVVFAYVATRPALTARADALWRALADGSIKTPPIERHALDAAGRAHERLESRATTGALVLIA